MLSSERKKHLFKDYAVIAIGVFLSFSPYLLSTALSSFRISWNEDNSISVTEKSKDPYHLSGSAGNGGKCAKGKSTSNDLKNIDIDDYYSYVKGSKERKVFAARSYVEEISEEILCQIGDFYQNNDRYPNESELKGFSSKAINDDIRNGVYSIKLEVGAEPNDQDFTVIFDKNCTNKTVETGNIAVLSPLYGDDGRYCVYNSIDEILKSF